MFVTGDSGTVDQQGTGGNYGSVGPRRERRGLPLLQRRKNALSVNFLVKGEIWQIWWREERLADYVRDKLEWEAGDDECHRRK